MRRLGLLAALAMLLWGCTCGDDEAATSAGAVGTGAAERDTEGGQDPVLAEARRSIVDGQLPSPIVDTLLASEAPPHQRARRILAAMQPGGEASAQEEDSAAPVPVVPPPIPAEGDPTATPPPVPVEATPSPAPTPPPSSGSLGGGSSKSSRRAGRASLSRISLRESQGGATLTLHASGGVVVGVANQRSSGIVRLIVESSAALPKVLSSRPGVTGVRVTSIRHGSNSIFVTLALEPGWSLGPIRRFSGGARIHLQRPG